MPKRKHSEIEGAGQTVTVKLADVPGYLQSGELFRSMQSEDGYSSHEDGEADLIDAPAKCIKLDQSVSSVDDAWSLLQSLRYWIAGSDHPSTLVAFCLSPEGKRLPASFWKSFEHQFEHMDVLRRMTNSNAKDPSAKVRMAIATGNVNLVRQVHEILQRLPSSACIDAAESGSLLCLQYVHQRMAMDRSQKVVKACIEAGSLECLQFALQKGYTMPSDACSLAAQKGTLPCLQYLFSLPSVRHRDQACFAAARSGHLDCLQFAAEAEAGLLPFDLSLMDIAVDGRSCACVEYLHERGVPWDEYNCSIAAQEDLLECLVYMHEHGCPWDEETCLHAARYGNLRCLQYAHEHGCQWSESICKEAAAYGNLNCLQYAHEHGCPWDESTCAAAVRAKDIACLEYAHEHGCQWNAHTCYVAAGVGNLACLKYLHEHGCPWDASTCCEAARAGALTHLQYAHEHGCPWDASVCVAAVYGHALQCLQYAHGHGCDWDTSTCTAAVHAGAVDCLRHAHEHECPWDTDAWTAGSDAACIAYLCEHGCPFPSK